MAFVPQKILCQTLECLNWSLIFPSFCCLSCCTYSWCLYRIFLFPRRLQVLYPSLKEISHFFDGRICIIKPVFSHFDLLLWTQNDKNFHEFIQRMGFSLFSQCIIFKYPLIDIQLLKLVDDNAQFHTPRFNQVPTWVTSKKYMLEMHVQSFLLALC